MRNAHVVVGWALIIANGLVGVWALVAHFHERFRRRVLWFAVAAAELLVVVQVGIGVAYDRQVDVERDSFHELYGYAAFVSIGLVYAYRNEMKDRLHLLYGLGSLWIMGLGIRALLL